MNTVFLLLPKFKIDAFIWAKYNNKNKSVVFLPIQLYVYMTTRPLIVVDVRICCCFLFLCAILCEVLLVARITGLGDCFFLYIRTKWNERERKKRATVLNNTWSVQQVEIVENMLSMCCDWMNTKLLYWTAVTYVY